MFRTSVAGSYFKTDISRNYFGLEDILSKTKGHGSSISAMALYSFKKRKYITPGLGIRHYYNHTNSRYLENGSTTPNTYVFQETLLYAYMRLHINQHFRGHIELHGHRISENPGTGTDTEYKVTPFIYLGYSLPKNMGDFSLEASMDNNSPQAGQVNATERRRDEFLMTAGNPYLRISNIYNIELSYRLNRKWGSIGIFSLYNNRNRAIYRNYICDNERDMFIETYANGGNFEHITFNTSIQLRIIPNKLNFAAGISYRHFKSRTFTLNEVNHVDALIRANYMNKGFVADIEAGTPRRRIDATGMYIKEPYKVNLTVGYNINNWSFNFMTRNPFMKTYTETILNLPNYKTTDRTRNPKLSYDYFAVRISYRFNYGKPHNFDNVGADSKVKNYDLGE